MSVPMKGRTLGHNWTKLTFLYNSYLKTFLVKRLGKPQFLTSCFARHFRVNLTVASARQRPCQHLEIFFAFKNCRVLYLFETYLRSVAAANRIFTYKFCEKGFRHGFPELKNFFSGSLKKAVTDTQYNIFFIKCAYLLVDISRANIIHCRISSTITYNITIMTNFVSEQWHVI